MNFEWDEQKNQENIHKHGLDFTDAWEIFEAPIDSMADGEIDTSDIPPLEEDFFHRAQWRMPGKKTAVTLSVDDDVLKWFEAQGAEFQHRINAALRIYAEAHRE